eukprot:gene7294-9937_t
MSSEDGKNRLQSSTSKSSPLDNHPIIKIIHKYHCLDRFSKFVVVFLFFLSGILFYKHYEGWGWFKSLHFTVVTISTVGYGYEYPSDDLSRLFTIFFIFIGIFVIFSGINDIILHQISILRSRTAASNNHFRDQLFYSVGILILVLFFGAIFLMLNEHWSFIEAFYFAMETSTTVGYGDLDIKYQSTFIFLVFYILISTVTVGYAINNFTSLVAELRSNQLMEDAFQHRSTIDYLSSNMNDFKGMNKNEFILAMLVHVGKIDKATDIEPLAKKFDEMDIRGSGMIGEEELSVRKSQMSVSNPDYDDDESSGVRRLSTVELVIKSVSEPIGAALQNAYRSTGSFSLNNRNSMANRTTFSETKEMEMENVAQNNHITNSESSYSQNSNAENSSLIVDNPIVSSI